MTSILTNTAALAALQTLRSIDAKMQRTESRVSSGFRVQTAADNAAYWSIATTMRSDNSALSTVKDALGLGAAKMDTYYQGMTSAIDVVTQIKVKLVAAREPGVDKGKVNQEITQLKDQLASIAQSATFSGENWLYNDSTASQGTKQIVSSFSRSADGSVSVSTLAFDTTNSTLIDTQNAEAGLLTRDISVTQPSAGTTSTGTYYLINSHSTTGASGTEISIGTSTSSDDLDGMISAVESILQTLTASASTIGAISSRIDLQTNFVQSLMGVIDKGVGRLVDADMNEESTQLKALQTQQQLGIQSLSIANTNAENILQLFK